MHFYNIILVKKYFCASIPVNPKITRFTQTVNFAGNNQILIASCIQKIGTCVTMNELSTNNGLNNFNTLVGILRNAVRSN